MNDPSVGPLESQMLHLIQEVVDLEVPGTDTDLLETGILDSMAMVNLLSKLEEIYEIEIAVEDLELEMLRTPKRIASFLSEQVTGSQV